MYCVIQEIELKKVPAGESKEIEVYETTWTINGEHGSTWGWRYSDEHFGRPVRIAYRISIHESYREAGRVKKKQTVICTIGYYSIVDWGGWIGDYIKGGLKRKADALKKVKADYKAKRDYERRSQKESRNYYERFFNNYGGNSGSSYGGNISNNYNEDNKAMLKKFYRTLSKAYHPDSNPGVDTSEEMKLLNQLKGDWGV